MKWFIDCHCIEDVKSRYRELSKKYHPDMNGGSAESEKIMKQINAEYEKAAARYKNIHRKAETAEAETVDPEPVEIPEELAEIVAQVKHMDGVNVEIIGKWVWLSGNTYAYKDTIKSLGFMWAKKKKAWYYHEGEYVKTGYRQKSMQDIREKYGSATVKTEKILQIA